MVKSAQWRFREPARVPGGAIFFGEFTLLLRRRQLLHGDRQVALGARAFDLLAVLVSHAGMTLDKRFLLKAVWPEQAVDEANLRIHIATLRRVLEAGGERRPYLINEPGRGYVLVAEPHGRIVPGADNRGQRRPGRPVATGDHGRRYRFGCFVFDPGLRELRYRGCPVALGSRALTLLQQLLRRAGETVPSAELIDAIWPSTCVEQNNLRVQVAALRKALAIAPGGGALLQTGAGGGYRLAVPVTMAWRPRAELSAPGRAKIPRPARIARLEARPAETARRVGADFRLAQAAEVARTIRQGRRRAPAPRQDFVMPWAIAGPLRWQAAAS